MYEFSMRFADHKCFKVHVALATTKPNVAEQDIRQSGRTVLKSCSHIVGAPSLDGVQGDSPGACTDSNI